MPARPSPPPWDHLASDLIRRLAQGTAARMHHSGYTAQDVEQEFHALLCEKFSACDLRLGDGRGFVSTLLRRHGANLVRACRAQKRRARGTAWKNLSQAELQQTCHDVLRAHLGVNAPDEGARAGLRVDVDQCLKRLPRSLRIIARGLMEQGPTELAERLGISRFTLRRRIQQLRQHPVAAVLKTLVPGPNSFDGDGVVNG